MDEQERDEGHKTGEESPDYGERESQEPGHPAGGTSPEEGVEPGTHEHPDDIKQPPDQERDQTDTESPASPPDPASG